jgi:hypothetical protein
MNHNFKKEKGKKNKTIFNRRRRKEEKKEL